MASIRIPFITYTVGFTMGAAGVFIGALISGVNLSGHHPPPPPPPPPQIQEFRYRLDDGRTMPCLQLATSLDCDWWELGPAPPPFPLPPAG